MDRSGLLDGKEEIREFLGNPGDTKLKTWLKHKMPVRIDNAGRWLAHKDNLEEFFKLYTLQWVENPQDIKMKDEG